MVTRAMSTLWRSAIRRARSWGTSSKACAVWLTLLCGSCIHSAKLLMAVCTTSAMLARCDASRSAKNGNRSPMTETASVASRPEYCFNRRSTDSGTVSSISSGDRGCLANGPAKGLSFTPKTYASFLEVSPKGGAWRS